ncbi:hypothetical protein P2R11_19090, partial [Escherichia coli]
KACVLPENPASYRVVRTKSYLFNKARKLQKKEAISGKGISPTNTSGYKYYCAAGVLAGC